MFSIVQLLKWKRSNLPGWSHSVLVDFQQVYVRNILLFCFGLCLERRFFGDNILCQMDGHRIGQELLNAKCFINGTFSKNDKLDVIYHDYYQWIPVLLLVLAYSFHFPYRVWSKYTSAFIKELGKEIENEQDYIELIETLSKGDCLYWKTIALETFYGVQLTVIIVVIDVFFNRVWSSVHWSWTAIPILFPEMVSCNYDYFSSGGITSGRFRCLLPLNAVYRRAFVGLYVLCLFLMVAHIVYLIYRFVSTIIVGKNKINIWWNFQVAKSLTHSWRVRCALEKEWKRMYYDRIQKSTLV